jgi:predicted nuclease of predicted toxin-antitoxin system
MKLLLDQGLPRSAAKLLRDAGVDTVHTTEIGMARASDAEILAYSREEQRVIVTLDADFHALLSLSNATSPSVIRIRIEGLKAEAVAQLLIHIAEDWSSELESGVMLSVQRRRIGVRYLPVSGSRSELNR